MGTHLMLVISFLIESETVREWPASTDHLGGSFGLTARERAVWMRPAELSNMVLAEERMGSMALRPYRESAESHSRATGQELPRVDPSSFPGPQQPLPTSGLIWAGMVANSGLEAKAVRFSTASISGAVASRQRSRFSGVKAPSKACGRPPLSLYLPCCDRKAPGAQNQPLLAPTGRKLRGTHTAKMEEGQPAVARAVTSTL